jgi:guanine deaminase
VNREFLSSAIELAVENVVQRGGGPFGAVIVQDEKIIAKGWNQVTAINDPTAHAEIVAIREACRQSNNFSLHECAIYCSCEPCPMCFGAIQWARLSTVFFAASADDAARAGFDDSRFRDEIRQPLADSSRQVKQFAVAGSDRPFDAWRGRANRIEY